MRPSDAPASAPPVARQASATTPMVRQASESGSPAKIRLERRPPVAPTPTGPAPHDHDLVRKTRELFAPESDSSSN